MQGLNFFFSCINALNSDEKYEWVDSYPYFYYSYCLLTVVFFLMLGSSLILCQYIKAVQNLLVQAIDL